MFTRRRPRTYAWIRVAPVATRRRLTSDRIVEPWAEGISELMAANALPIVAPDRFSFADALEQQGVPASEKSPEEELIELLQEAADIEHGLMLQYLYAVYSLKELMIQGTVRTIAIEEMGHFVTVQNLLVACGAEPSLGNSDWDVPNVFHPFPFKLEPASVGSIAKYTIAEMPDRGSVPDDIKADLDQIINDGDTAAGSPVEPHRVGLLYTKIYWLLRPDDHPLPDPTQEPWRGFPVAAMAATPELAGRHVRDGFVRDSRDVNAQPEQWRGNYTSVIVAPISGRDSALLAIAHVTAQGEGYVDAAQSHFHRFVESWRLAKKTSDLALPAAINPGYATAGASPISGDEITSAVGRQLAALGDGLYELVLLCTAVNLLLPAGTAPEDRTTAAQTAVTVMRECLGRIARVLSAIPLTDDGANSKVCGLPFVVSPLDVDAKLKPVVDRAKDVINGLKAVATALDQGNAGQAVKLAAEDVAGTIDDTIVPWLTSLPV